MTITCLGLKDVVDSLVLRSSESYIVRSDGTNMVPKHLLYRECVAVLSSPPVKARKPVACERLVCGASAARHARLKPGHDSVQLVHIGWD